MKTLQEIYECYKPFGMSDIQIIEKYFTENKLEAEGVELLTKLSKKQINYLHEKNNHYITNIQYVNSALSNLTMPSEDRLKLHQLITTFTFFRDLDEEELQEAKRIFDTGVVMMCPNYFIAYLKEKGVMEGENTDFDKECLNKVLYEREN